MRINPTTQTIGNFFNNPNEQFFVPAYQRRYAWGISQLGALFNDINLLKDGDTHLLGMVVLLADIYNPNVNQLELVDGQQRITTLCVLLKVIQGNLNNDDNVDEVREINKYLSCRSSDKRQHKIILGDLDHSDFVRIMNDKTDDELENIKLVQARDFFASKIKESNFDIIGFYRKLMNQVEIIRLDIGQAKDAYKLFETINNRGLKLSAADIVKNFLLGHASILGSDTLEEVKGNWRQLILNLDELGYSDMDKFFRQFLMGRIKLKVPNSRLIEEFKNYYYLNIKESEKLSDYSARIELIGRRKNRLQEAEGSEGYEDNGDESIAKFSIESYQQKKMGIISFAKELKKCSLIYQSLILGENEDGDISRKLKALKSIESLPAYTFLMYLVNIGVEKDEYLKILDLVECFILRRQVCEYRTGELDDIFSKLCQLSNRGLLNSVEEELFDHFPEDKEFEEKFPLFNNKGSEERAKHLLWRIECYKYKRDTKEIDIRKDVQLEHIIPQTIIGKKAREENGGDWVKYLGGDKNKVKELHKKYLNKIGNLTILGQPLNAKASNNPFYSKCAKYEESNFCLNRDDLVKNYKRFKFPQVDQRGKKLAEMAVKIWKF